MVKNSKRTTIAPSIDTAELIKAHRALKAADHMLTQTYPLLKESKLLLNVLLHIGECYVHLLRAAHCKGDDLATMLSALRPRARLYQLDATHLGHAHDVHLLLHAHKLSPVEFSRKEKFVICDEHYATRVLTKAVLGAHIAHAKVFIERLASVGPHAP